MALLATWQHKQAVIVARRLGSHPSSLRILLRRSVQELHLEEDQSILPQLRKDPHPVPDLVNSNLILQRRICQFIAAKKKSHN